jgi:Integrase core domain.
MRVACEITLTDDERQTLTRWSRGRRTPARLVLRAKIILLCAEERLNKDIAVELATARKTVARWRNRFVQKRLSGLEKDAPRPGRTAKARDAVARKIVAATTQEQPAAATHWSTRSLAKHLGVSPSMVQRVWKANRLQPHRIKTFKLSNDKHFAEKLVDVVGLYLSPPEHAIVLCVDEKTQIQALDRTQKSLPIYPGRCGTMTHDYKRNGTTTLFAALNVLEGLVIGTCMPRHRHQEWIKFLAQIDTSTPPDVDLHLIADNYATHKHPQVQRWLKRHPRFHMHFIPTSSSWLNLVERWFRDLTQQRIRRGVFHSARQLKTAIEDYIEHHNNTTEGYTWTAKAEDILEKVRRAREVLDKTPSE